MRYAVFQLTLTKQKLIERRATRAKKKFVYIFRNNCKINTHFLLLSFSPGIVQFGLAHFLLFFSLSVYCCQRELCVSISLLSIQYIVYKHSFGCYIYAPVNIIFFLLFFSSLCVYSIFISLDESQLLPSQRENLIVRTVLFSASSKHILMIGLFGCTHTHSYDMILMFL